MLSNNELQLAVYGRNGRQPLSGRVPDFVPPSDLVPASTASSQMPSLHTPQESARALRLKRLARERVDQQNAIDAPFQAIARDSWNAKCGDNERGARQRAARGGAALGLVSNETSGTKEREVEAGRLPRGHLLDRDAARLKRMRTVVGHAARLLHFDAHEERHAQRWNLKFITLTYAADVEWEAGHFSKYRDAMRQWCKRRNVRMRFVWVAELQQRGAIHYHIVVWLPKGKYLPHADAQGWWPHGSTNIKTAQSPVGYITKYASKATAAQAAQYPKGARMCGHGGLPPEGRRHVRYWQSPFWVRDALSGRADIRKVVGGYMDKFTGEFLPSPWRVVFKPGGEVWAYRIDQQETVQ